MAADVEGSSARVARTTTSDDKVPEYNALALLYRRGDNHGMEHLVVTAQDSGMVLRIRLVTLFGIGRISTNQRDVAVNLEGHVTIGIAVGHPVHRNVGPFCNMDNVARCHPVERGHQRDGVLPRETVVAVVAGHLHIIVVHQIARLTGELNHLYPLLTIAGHPDNQLALARVYRAVTAGREGDLAITQAALLHQGDPRRVALGPPGEVGFHVDGKLTSLLGDSDIPALNGVFRSFRDETPHVYLLRAGRYHAYSQEKKQKPIKRYIDLFHWSYPVWFTLWR
jgi:hypothetical protein